MRGTSSIYARSLSDLPSPAAKAFIAKVRPADLGEIFTVALLSTFSTVSTDAVEKVGFWL
jgi:hypothetical protein